MSIRLCLLGKPGRDNALFLAVDTGQRISRLLFDCGQCLAGLARSDLAHIDHVFFSHLHMDHVCGFDAFFRLVYNRSDKPISIFGPPGTIAIMHHRFRGVVWNLHDGEPGEWVVREIHPDRIETARFYTAEAFAIRHDETASPFDGSVVLRDADFTVRATTLDHGIPSMGYMVREADRWNVRSDVLSVEGLTPGAWLHALKDAEKPDEGIMTVQGRSRSMREWRRHLLQLHPGDSAAYLTDFRLDDASMARLGEWLKPCRVLVCESQYCKADEALARQMGHLTATQAARLAGLSGVERLIMFHVSDRYSAKERGAILAEACAVFPGASWPDTWHQA